MFIRDNLWELKPAFVDEFPKSIFLVMFIAVVVMPFVLFVIGGRDPNIQSQPGLFLYTLAIPFLLLVGVGIGFSMYRNKPNAIRGLSISPNLR